MIQELRIENFAIIDRLELALEPGLVVFTGETGAGKSIIIDAVETLLGGRSDPAFVRTGAPHANVEGIFAIPEGQRAPLGALLKAEGLLDEAENGAAEALPGVISLGREIRNGGRSIARINGRSVSLALLRQVGEYLVDVHGQSEHLSLLRVSHHLGLLDSFSGKRGDAYPKVYRRLQGVRKELADLRAAESEAARRSDILNFQINEIESARLRPGEEEELRSERNRLANAEGLTSAAQEALQAIEEGGPEAPAAADLLGQAAHAVSTLARLDPSQAALQEQAQSLVDGLEELARGLHESLERIEFNPRRLDQVEERLNLIYNLKRKYTKGGASAASSSSIDEVLAFAQEAQRQLHAIEHANERIAALEAEAEKLVHEAGQLAWELSQARHAAAVRLEKALENELEQLSMSGAHFKVAFTTRPDPQGLPLPNGERVAFDGSGIEQVEFLVAPNPGEGLKPLVKVASGGETSRLMLGIKNVLARADQVPTLIFDEIDQGIGGRVGAVVGRKLWDLARSHQVLCITHLPQLAAFGENHFSVQKRVQDGRTSTVVTRLTDSERQKELAQMMGEVSEGTLQSAIEMLHTAQHTQSGASKTSKKATQLKTGKT